MVEDLQRKQAELLADLEHAKAMRLFDLIKPPFADNAGGDPQKKKWRISGMHADGTARVVTSGELKASIEEAERPKSECASPYGAAGALR